MARRVSIIFIIGGMDRTPGFVAVTFLNIVYTVFLAVFQVSADCAYIFSAFLLMFPYNK